MEVIGRSGAKREDPDRGAVKEPRPGEPGKRLPESQKIQKNQKEDFWMNFKKVLALVLVLSMLLSMIPTYAFADDELLDEVAVEEEAPAEVYDEWLEEEEGPAEEPAEEPAAEEPAAEELDEEPAAEEPAAEEPAAEPADAANDVQGLEAGETLELNDGVVAASATKEFLTLKDAFEDPTTEFTLKQNATATGVTVTHAVTVYGNTYTVTGDITINAPGAVVELRNMTIEGNIILTDGTLVMGDANGNVVTVTGTIVASGGTLTITKGTFNKATAASNDVTGNVTGGTFTNGISDYLCAEGYGYNASTKEVELMSFVAQINEGKDRVRYATFTDAVEVAGAEKTIKLLDDVTHRFEKNQTLKINKNGKTFTANPFSAEYYVTSTEYTDYTEYTSHHFVAKVDNTYCKTIEDAVGVAGSSKVIELLENVSYQLKATDKIQVKAGSFTFDASVPEGYILVRKSETGSTYTYAVSTPLRVTATAPADTSDWGWQTSSGTGYLADKLDDAVNAAIEGNKILVAVSGSYEVSLATGETLKVKELSGATVKVTAEDPATYLSPKGTADDNGVKSYGIAKYAAKVVVGEDTKYFTKLYTDDGAFAYANNNVGSTLTVLVTLADHDYTMIPDLGKSLKVDWNGLRHAVTVKSPRGDYFVENVADGDVITYWLVAAQADIVGRYWYKTFPNAVVGATQTDTIRLLADIEEPYTMDPAVKTKITVNHNKHSVTILPPDGYALFVDDELYTPEAGASAFTSGIHTYEIQKAYTVTFDPNNGKEPWTETVYDKGVKEPEEPTNPGYTFDGWYNGDTKFESWNTKLTGNLNLKAKWTAVKYVLYSYNYIGATGTPSDLLNTRVVEYGETITEPRTEPTAPPPVPGTTFQGWAIWNPDELWINDIPNYDPITFSFVLNEDIIKYAVDGAGEPEGHKAIKIVGVWAVDKHTVIFDADGGTFTYTEKIGGTEYTASAGILENNEMEVGTTFSGGFRYPKTDPERAGYRFLGWRLNKQALVQTNQLVTAMPAQDLSYVAEWEVAVARIGEGTDAKYFETFAAAVNAVATDTDVIDLLDNIEEPFTMSAAKPKITVDHNGYSLTMNPPEGYGLFDNGVLKVPARRPADEEPTRHVYEIQKGITVTFDPDNGKDTWTEFVYNEGVQKPETDPEKAGYTFNGWTLNGIKIEEEEWPVTAEQDITIKAAWKAEKYRIYTFSYITVDDDGTVKPEQHLNTIIVEFGREITAPVKQPVPPEPNPGSTFKKWVVANPDNLWVNDIPTYTDVEFPFTLDEAMLKFAGSPSEYEGVTTEPEGAEEADKAIFIIGIWETDKHTVSFDADGGTFSYNKLIGGKERTVTGSSIVNSDMEVGADLDDGYHVPSSDPERTGYEFLGWRENDQALATTSDLPKTMPAADLSYVAEWKLVPYAITYTGEHLAGADLPESYTVEDLSLTIPALTYEGYTFNGWTSDTLKITRPVQTVTIPVGTTGDIDFKANWTHTTYTLTFDINGGKWATDTDARITVYTGDNILGNKPAEATRTGYKLLGWKFEDGSFVTPESVMPEASITVTADWGEPNQYRITYYLGGGDNTGNPDIFTVEDLALTLKAPTKEGNTFTGWSLSKDGETYDPFVIGEDYTNDVTLYANWSVNSYTLTLDANGGSFATDTDLPVLELEEDYATKLGDVLKQNVPTRDGYALVGWDTQRRDEVPETMPAGDLTLYAVWEALPVYVIVNYNDGGAHKITVTQVDFDKLINEPDAIEFAGHTLEGWYALRGNVGQPTGDYNSHMTVIPYLTETMDDFAEAIKAALKEELKDGMHVTPEMLESIIGGVSYDVLEEIQDFGKLDEALDQSAFEMHATFPITLKHYHTFVYLHADWTTEEYPITFNLDGGHFRDGDPVYTSYNVENDTFTIPQPVKDGYDFAGWTGTDLTEPTKVVTIAKGSTGDREYTATWTAKQIKVTVDYNDGGQTPTDNYMISFGEAINHPTDPVHDGWTLTEWTVSPLDNGFDPDFFAFPYTPEQYVTSIEVKATWEQNVYTITYMGEHGERYGADKYHYDDPVSVRGGVAKTGYTFAGWVPEIPMYMPMENLVVTPSYTINTHTLTLDANGGHFFNGDEKVVSSVDYGTEFATETWGVPAREGYTFAGWTAGPDTPLPTSMPDEDVTLKAVWVVKTHTLTLNANGGVFAEGPTSYVAPFGEAMSPDLWTKVSREGYQFLGWFYEDGAELPATMPDEDVEAFAFWSVRPVYVVTNYNDGSKYDLAKVDFGEPINEPAAREFEGHTFNGWYALRFNIYEQTTDHTGMTVNPYVSELMDGHIEAIHAALKDEFKPGIPVTMEQIKAILAKVEKSEGIEIAADKLEAMPFDMHATFPINLQNYHTLVYIYADWSLNTHSVTFETGDGAFTDNTTEKVIEPIGFGAQMEKVVNLLPSNPKQEGYDFAGWTLRDGSALPTTMPDEDVIAYAKWTPAAVKVTFNRGNGAARIIDPVSGLPIEDTSYTIDAHFGDSVPDMVDVVWPDHEYIWVEKTYGINPLPDTIPAGGLEFTAKWIGVSSTVYFNANGGKINDMHNDRVDGFYLTGTVDDAIFPNGHTFDAAREGYTWHSWSVDGEHIDNLPTNFPAVDTEYVALWDVNKWNVTFTGGGAKIQDPATLDMVSEYTVTGVAYGDTVGYPPLPELPGYTFNGWYENVDGFNTVETMPDRNLKFVASWTANEITVTFDGNGGLIKGLHNGDFVPSYSVTGHVGDALTFPEASKAEGYTGHAWSDAEGTHLDPLPTEFPAEDTTYTLVWDVNVHSITFDANGGTVIRPFSGGEAGSYTEAGIAYGSEIEMPENPTKTGYIFDGWYEDSYYGFNYPTEMPDRDLNFVAQWHEEEHTITLNANGGLFTNDLGETSETYTITGLYGAPVTYPADPELEGYTLTGWADENGEKIVSRIFNIPAEDVTYYAIWEINEIEVTYRPRGGVAINPVTLLEESDDFTVTYKFGDELILPQISRDGYDFAGWADTQYGWVIPETVPDVPTKQMTINAFWAGQDFMVSFDANGGTVATKALHVNTSASSVADTVAYYAVVGTPDDSMTGLFPIPTSEKKEGYVFHSWVDQEGTHYTTQNLIDMMTKFPTQDMHFVADWTIDTFTATFDTNNGTAVRPFSGGEINGTYDETVTFNETIPMPTDIARPGYTFQGWYEDNWFGYNYPAEMPARDLHFTAQWTADEHTITYETDGGIIATADGLRVWDLPYVITAVTDFDLLNADPSLYPLQPTKEGYTFQYWLGSDENTYQQGPNTMPAEDLVLTAIWKINPVDVTYVPNGGTAIHPETYWPTKDNFTITYNYGDELILPQVTREGYLFGGWVENTKYGWNYPTTIADEAAALQFTAVWVGADYTVTFDANGGLMKTYALRGNAVTGTSDTVGYYTIVGTVEDPITRLLPLDEPTREGYTFQYWLDEDGAHWSNAALNEMTDPNGFFPAENKTFVAEWKVNPYTVTFNSGDNGAVLINPNTGLAVTNQTYSQEVNFGETIPFPADPTRPGHTFIGWTETELGYNYPTEMPAKALTFTAQWQVNEITYTFDANGGDMYTNALDDTTHYDVVDLYSTTGKYNSTVKAPQTMAKEGYSFHGWIDQNGKHYDWNDPATTTFGPENMTFKAEWVINSYNVTFNAVSPDAEMLNPNTGLKTTLYTQAVVFGETIPFPADPVLAGHTFNGWNAVLEAQSYPVAAAVNVGFNYPSEMPARDITFTAQWTVNDITYTFDANGGDMYTTALDGSTHHDVVDLYSTTGKYNSTVKAPQTMAKEGYSFHGWIDQNGKHYDWNDPATTTFGPENMTFKAEWVINSYNVTFNAVSPDAEMLNPNTGLKTTLYTQAVVFGETIPFPADPVLAGHTFNGWNAVLEAQSYPVAAAVNVGFNYPSEMPARDITFTAQWTVNDITYTFDANGGDMYTNALDDTTHYDVVDLYSTTGKYNSTVKAPQTMAKEGYSFHGWIDQNGKHYDWNDPATTTFGPENMTFKAEWVINSYNVTFNAASPDAEMLNPNTGVQTTLYSQAVVFGETIPFPADPVLAGHTFNGWNAVLDAQSYPVAAAENVGYNYPSEMPARDITFTAQWAINKYTITLDANGGLFTDELGLTSDIYMITENFNTSLTGKWPATAPELEGFTLKGWMDEDGNTYVNIAAEIPNMPAKDMTLTAVWEINEYVVVFRPGTIGTAATIVNPITGVAAGAGAQVQITVPYGEPIPYAEISAEGYEFDGWVEDQLGYALPETMPGRAVGLTATWAGIDYSVTFDGNGGTIATKALDVSPATTVHIDYVPSYTVVGNLVNPRALQNLLPLATDGSDYYPKRVGYTFHSWVDEEGTHYTTAELPWDFTAKNKVFTAEWVANPHTIYFNANGGGVISPVTLAYVPAYIDNITFGDEIVYPEEPTRVGYQFMGWYEITKPYGFNVPATMPDADLELYAQWAPIANTVVYDANGGTIVGKDGYEYEVLTIEAETGAQIYAPQVFPVRYGYTFTGWYDENDDLVPNFASLVTTMPALGKTYTAHWAPYDISVIFHYNLLPGDVYTSQIAQYDDFVRQPMDPEATGHSFNGWYYIVTDGGYGRYGDPFDFDAPLTTFTFEGDNAVLHLVAKFDVNSYTVNYNANEGLVKGEDGSEVGAFAISAEYNKPIYHPGANPVREGYDFLGWFNENTQSMATALPTTMPAEDTFFTAQWYVHYYKATFNGNGGVFALPDSTTTDSIALDVAFGQPIPVPAAPTMEGYDFMGWDVEVPESMPASNLTFTAKWQAKTYTVSFDSNGGATSYPDQLVQHGAYASKPLTNPYRNGYTFQGWFEKYSNGTLAATEFDFANTPIGKDYVLVAKWLGNEVTLRWGDRNVYMLDQKVRVGDFIVRPEFNVYYFQQLVKDGRREGYRLDPEHLWTPEPPEYVEESLYGMMYQLNWIKQIQIIFLDENSNVITTMYVDENSTLAQNPDAPAPAKEGYNLLWTINGKTIDENTPITAEGPVTMKATYVEKPVEPVEQTWTVTFNSDGGTEVKTQTIVDGETAAAPVDPVKDGYKFIGWTLDGEIYDFKTPVTANITLTAVYEEIPYVTGLLSMQLKNNFILHYYVNDLREGTRPSDYTVSFNGGEEKTLTRTDSNLFRNVGEFSATQLLNSIPVVVKYQGEVVFEDEISVRNYCDRVFNAYGHDHNNSLVVICEAALNYGSQAQLYVGDTGELANYGEWYVAPGEDIPFAETYKTAPITGITDGVSSLRLGSSVSQLFYAYHGKKAKMSDYTFLLNGMPVSGVRDLGNAYVVQIAGIPVTNLVNENTLTVIYHEGQADQETFTISAAPTAFMYETYQSEPGSTMGQLSYYLYNYYLSTTLTDNR